MSTSIPERIAQAVQAALLADPPMLEVLDRVERAREDSFSREAIEAGAINILSGEERTRLHSQEIDDNELDIDIEINVRGTVWESAADVIAIQVHRRVKTHAYPGLALAQILKTGRSPKSQSGDYTPGQLTLTYTYRYLTRGDDITLQP